MAPAKKPWFRTYVEMLTDPKMRRLKPEHRWVWVAVLGAARMSPIPGHLLLSESEALTVDDIAELAGVTTRCASAALSAMASPRLGLLVEDEAIGCLVVAKWQQRQYESDDVTARTRKHREKSSNNDGTLQGRSRERSSNVDGTSQRQRTEAETENREPSAPNDIEQPSLLPAVIEQPATPARRRDPLFDALVEACGYRYDEMTERQTKACGVARAQLAKVHATPEQIIERARVYAAKFPTAQLTPNALANQWAGLNPDRQRQTQRPQLGRSSSALVNVGERLAARSGHGAGASISQT